MNYRAVIFALVSAALFGVSTPAAKVLRGSLLATAAQLPTIYIFRENVEAGGLMSYGIVLRENWRRAAIYVDKILKGAKPGDLPVELPTKFELVINTAKALGITIPPAIMIQADEVIE
jgi:putative ABC transport system substrate-binding protein